MDLVTAGRENLKGYRLLLCCSDTIPSPEDMLSSFKMILVESGTCTITHQDAEMIGTAPALLCLGQGEIPAVAEPGTTRLRCLFFHPCTVNGLFDFENIRSGEQFQSTVSQDWYLLMPFIKREQGCDGRLALSYDQLHRISSVYQAIGRVLEDQKDTAWPCRSRSYLLELLILINRIMEEREIKKTGSSENPMTGILAYLQAHYQEKITVSDLARQFKMNRTTLNQLFLENTHTSAFAYVIQLRIHSAAVFLRDTLLNVSEIMERSGFSNHTHFWRMFKKQTGLSPSEYRNRYNRMRQ